MRPSTRTAWRPPLGAHIGDGVGACKLRTAVVDGGVNDLAAAILGGESLPGARCQCYTGAMCWAARERLCLLPGRGDEAPSGGRGAGSPSAMRSAHTRCLRSSLPTTSPRGRGELVWKKLHSDPDERDGRSLRRGGSRPYGWVRRRAAKLSWHRARAKFAIWTTQGETCALSCFWRGRPLG